MSNQDITKGETSEGTLEIIIFTHEWKKPRTGARLNGKRVAVSKVEHLMTPSFWANA